MQRGVRFFRGLLEKREELENEISKFFSNEDVISPSTTFQMIQQGDAMGPVILVAMVEYVTRLNGERLPWEGKAEVAKPIPPVPSSEKPQEQPVEAPPEPTKKAKRGRPKKK